MRKHKTARAFLNSEAKKTIFIDLCQRHQIEACGVLLGWIAENGDWHIEQTQALRNTFDSPVYFEFDPEELLTMELCYPGRIIGVYHSHPTGFAKASSTDTMNMQRVNEEQNIPWIWLILCGPFDENFIQRGPEGISLLSYYHYPQRGLYHIEVKMVQDSEQAL